MRRRMDKVELIWVVVISGFRRSGGLCHKHKVTSTGTTRFPNEYLYDTIGLIKLSPGARNPSRAKT